MNELKFKTSIKGIETLQEKVENLKKLVDEINNISLEVNVELENEIEVLNNCATKIKNQELNS